MGTNFSGNQGCCHFSSRDAVARTEEYEHTQQASPWADNKLPVSPLSDGADKQFTTTEDSAALGKSEPSEAAWPVSLVSPVSAVSPLVSPVSPGPESNERTALVPQPALCKEDWVRAAAAAAASSRWLVADEALAMADLSGDAILNDSVATEFPILAQVPRCVQAVKHALSSCTPPNPGEPGWTLIHLQGPTPVEMWRKWNSDNLQFVLRWVAAGSFRAHVGSLRDSDVFEKLWDGMYWNMCTQHHSEAALVRFIEKDLLGHVKEVVLERIFCDCFNSDPPCWTVTERTPELAGFDTFGGQWRGFDIPGPTKGMKRATNIGMTRCMVPVSPDQVQIVMTGKFYLPSAVRWMMSDYTLGMIAKTGHKSISKSWGKILTGFESCFSERALSQAVFYDMLDERVKEYLAAKESSQR